ncbi:MAG: tryptophan 7-halogenase, partial [Opitutaceae bacterium]|nr:tryptophan 7-halogenase [Opitutaceae bacterium]
APRTIVTAHEAGWQWKMPLQHRQGNGYVYSSRFTDDETAKKRLLENIDGRLITHPRTFSFTPGRRNRAWNKNCIAVGLAAGFLEPLESTSIALVETAIDKIVQSLAQLTYDQKIVEHFNHVTQLEYECVRDFIILHYKANQRNDSLMWRYCQNMSVPKSLQTRMDIYQSSGKLARSAWDMFGADSWLAIYHGFNFLPQTYATKIDSIPLEQVQNGLLKMKGDIAKYTAKAPPHHHFLAQHFDYQSSKQE